MKKILFAACIFLTESAFAGIYKCVMPSGKVIYQSQACPDEKSGKEIEVEQFDQSKIEAAQRKLQADLKKQAEIDAQQAKKDTRQRQVKALEESKRAQEEQSEILEYKSRFYLNAQ